MAPVNSLTGFAEKADLISFCESVSFDLRSELFAPILINSSAIVLILITSFLKYLLIN